MTPFDGFFAVPEVKGRHLAGVAALRRDGCGKVVSATLIERRPWDERQPSRTLHWAAGIGSWEEQR